jgi:transcription elongation factor GreA
MSTIPLTTRGAKKLRDELQHLKSVERPAVVNSIAEARAQGDLSENAEYDAAKEKQGFIEGRIAEIESKLAGAQIIDPAAVDADGRIVGDDEADLEHGLISISSPIARALIGKSEGDVASVQAPGGVREYEIIAVSYI